MSGRDAREGFSMPAKKAVELAAMRALEWDPQVEGDAWFDDPELNVLGVNYVISTQPKEALQHG